MIFSNYCYWYSQHPPRRRQSRTGVFGGLGRWYARGESGASTYLYVAGRNSPEILL